MTVRQTLRSFRPWRPGTRTRGAPARLFVASFAAIMLFASACSTPPGAAADKAHELAQQEAARSSEPSATQTTVEIEAQAPPASRSPEPRPTPQASVEPTTEIEYLDLDDDGVINSEEDRISRGELPLVWGGPTISQTATTADTDFLDFDFSDVHRTVSFHAQPAGSPTIDTTTSTPDGLSTWIPFVDFLDRNTCDAVEGASLGIAPLDGLTPPRPAQPPGELPMNVSEIHHGPGDLVIFYTTCEGSTRPAAFAQMLPDGHFTAVTSIEDLFEDTVAAGEPRWISGGLVAGPRNGDAGEIIAVIPQVGLIDDASPDGTWANAYVSVTTGQLLDVWPTKDRWDFTVGSTTGWNTAVVTSDGETATVGEVSLAGPIEILQPPPLSAADRSRAMVVTPAGLQIATLETGPSRRVSVQPITEDRVLDAAWSPRGDAIAIVTDWEVMLFIDGQLEQLERHGGELPLTQAHFTPDGSTLILAGRGGFRAIRFRSSDAATYLDSQLTSAGIDPIRIGVTAQELRAELGIDVTVTVHQHDATLIGQCATITSPDLPGLTMLGPTLSATDATIKSISIRQGPWHTPSGIRLGSTEDQIRGTFPDQLDEREHQWVTGASYLTFVPEDPTDTNSIMFETDGHAVFAIHAGDHEWIERASECR